MVLFLSNKTITTSFIVFSLIGRREVGRNSKEAKQSKASTIRQLEKNRRKRVYIDKT
jgi:hypothetical protein